jgi:hypothetical protein
MEKGSPAARTAALRVVETKSDSKTVPAEELQVTSMHITPASPTPRAEDLQVLSMDVRAVSSAPQAAVFDMMMGMWVTRIMTQITKLGIPDILSGHGPSTAAELVRRGVDADPGALQRVLRASAAVGIVSEDETARFALNPVSKLLTEDCPGSMKPVVEFMGGLLWKIWGGLPEAIQTGQPQVHAQLGMEFFPYLTAHPESMEEFGEGMKANSYIVNSGVLAHYDFSGIRKMIDVGGGFGHLVVSVLEQYPQLQGVLFDLPDVVEAAPKQVPVRGSVASRLTYVGGDMFEQLPSADAYLLKTVLHDWDDERGIALLRKCCEQMESGGRVICVELVLPDVGDASAAASKLLDVSMMLMVKGRERTKSEWEMLFREAGLDITAVIPIPDTWGTCIIEGRKA